jgi:hypothetical protein
MFSDLYARIIEIQERATPQVKRPFYIGLAVGFALAVLVLLGLLNTATFVALPSSFEGVATSQAIWGLRTSDLLMVLPLGEYQVVLARSFIGMKAFGLFTPMLIALAFLQIGPVMGPVVLCSSVLVGMIVTPHLHKLRMTRVGFLGVLISLIVLVLVALQIILDTALQVDAFPVIVCALVVERWWKQWEKDGAKPAAWMAFNTFILAVVIQFVMVSNLAMMLIEWSPLLMPAATGVAIAVLGRYRGLRLSEIHRFAPIWLERRRNARAQEKVERAPAHERPVGCRDPTPLQLDLLHETVWTIDSVEDVLYAKRSLVEKPILRGEVPCEPRIRASDRPPMGETWVIRSIGDVDPSPPQLYRNKPKPGSESRFVARFDAFPERARHKAWAIRSVEDV